MQKAVELLQAARGWRRPGRTEVLLAVVSLLVGVLLVEGGLRLFTAPAFRLVNPAFFGDDNWFEFDAALEYTLRRNHRRTVTYRDDDGQVRRVDLRLGKEGVRGDVPTGDAAQPLVAFIGDSFTEGYHVDSLETYPALVGQALAGRGRVANLGVHNYNALNYYKMGVWAKERYAPQQVFVGLFVGNDILPYNRWSYKTPPNNRFQGFKMRLKSSLYLYSWLEMALKKHPAVAASPGAVAEPAAVEGFFDNFADIDLPADSLRQYVGQYTAYRRDAKMQRLYGDPWLLFLGIKGTVMVLDDLRRDLGDTRLHVLIFPERLQLHDKEWDWVQGRLPQTYRQRYQVLDELGDELAARGIAYTDMRQRLDAGSYLRFDGHFSAEGHRRVAAAVLEILR